MTATDEGTVLPCGRDTAEVWDAAGRDPDAHTRDCVHCAAVRARHDLLGQASAAYTAAAPPAPAALVDSVMRTVRTELRPGRPIGLASDAGPASAVDTAVTTALAASLDDDPAFALRRCRVEAQPAGAAAPGVRVALAIAVSYEHFAQHGDDAVRGRVVAAMARLFDLRVASVEIEIVDVLTDAP